MTVFEKSNQVEEETIITVITRSPQQEDDLTESRIHLAKKYAERLEKQRKERVLDSIAESANNKKTKITDFPNVQFSKTPMKMKSSRTWRDTLTCGLCEGLYLRPLRCDTPCSKQEVKRLSSDPICSVFSPLPPRAITTSPLEKNAIFDFADMLTAFSSDKLDYLASLILAEKTTRSLGFRFMQKVYYRYKGSSSDNYRGNFVLGYVLSVSKKTVCLTTHDLSTVMYIDVEGDASVFEGNGPSFYTEEYFNKFKEFMKGNVDTLLTDRIRRGKDTDSSVLHGLEEIVKNMSENSDAEKDKKIRQKVLNVDDLLAMSCSTNESKFKVVRTGKKRKRVRDLVDMTGDLVNAVRSVDTAYYDTGDLSFDESVDDSGLQDYYTEVDPEASSEDLSSSLSEDFSD